MKIVGNFLQKLSYKKSTLQRTFMKKNTTKSEKKPSLLKRFLAYYAPHKKLLIADMAASLLISAIGMIYPMVTNRMLNDLIPNQKIKLVVICGLAVLVLYALRYALRYFVQYYGHVIGVRM